MRGHIAANREGQVKATDPPIQAKYIQADFLIVKGRVSQVRVVYWQDVTSMGCKKKPPDKESH
jgi:uncharacterized protein with PhoU and TrkA domain